MKNDWMIPMIYKVAGVLEGLSCMQGQHLTEATTYILADCVDKLELVGAQLLAKEVESREGTKEAAWPEQASL